MDTPHLGDFQLGSCDNANEKFMMLLPLLKKKKEIKQRHKAPRDTTAPFKLIKLWTSGSRRT